MESMRKLHFGHNKSAEFTAHVHILDLHNVPLVEGDCRIKWRFQGGMSLNTTNNEKVMGQALQTSISYLKDLRNAASGASATSDDKAGGASAEYGDDGDHSLGGRFKDAISHAHRTLRASTLSHGSGDQLSPRSRSLSMPRSSSANNPAMNGSSNSPTSPSTHDRDTSPIWKTTAPNDYFRQGMSDEPVSYDPQGRPIRPTANQRYTASPPSSPRASTSYAANNLLSPTTTIRPSGSPRHTSALLNPTTPPSSSRPRQSTSTNLDHSTSYATTNLSRRTTAVPHSLEDDLNSSGHSLLRSPSSLADSLQKANMPSKAEVKGKTAYIPLIDHQVRFDKHIVCAVAIPMKKHSKHLEESVVKLKVLYKVRTTPLPERIGSRPAPSSTGQDGTASPANQAIRNHKTRINGSSVSISTPVHSGVSTLHINAKEAHEEICLGDLWINLSEFVSVDFARNGPRPGVNGQMKETWVTRRYLLQNGRTNALLRVAVKMDWISGVRDFTAPPLMKGQIISPKKQMSRTSDKSRDKEKDKDKASLYSGTSTNSSRLYLQGENASSRSFASVEYDSQTGRPRSLLQAPLYGKGGGHGVSSDDMSDQVSLANGHRHWNGISNPGHRYNSIDFGNNDEQADIDIIDAIFSKEDTPPSSPLHAIERKGYFDHHAAHHHAPSGSSLHPHSSTSEVTSRSHHHSPAQALAFLHRSKDKHGKGKIHTSSSTSQLAVEDTKGRKRVSSAPSKSIFGPLRSNSRSTTQLPTPTEQDTIEVHGAGNSYHHHHHHHHLGEEDEMRPVLVHIPTRQEPIDVHSHPFRWKGKPGPSMQSMSQASHGVHGFTSTSSLGGDDSGYAINDEHIHRLASVNVGSLEHEHDFNEHEKRKTTGSAAAHIFKNPFKNRSTSMLSTSSSVQSVPVSASAPQQQQAPVSSTSSPLHEEHHIQAEKDNEDAADMPRGSLDLQKTLRPSMEGDPSKIKMRRMTSPAKMTPAEEADLQLFIKQSVDGHPLADTFASAFDTSDDQLEYVQAEDSTRTTSRREQARRQSVSQLQRERERELDRRSQKSSGRDSVLSSHTSSSKDSREASLERTGLVRQPTNEEELDERARRLRERGLLPTLSITTSDDLPARPPKLTSYI